MSNEITALVGMPSESGGDGYALALATQQAYQISEEGFTHLWEISSPSYTGVNLHDHNKLIAFGEFSGSVGTHYIVVNLSATTFHWSKDGGSTWFGPFNITTAPIALDQGVQINYKIADGKHTINDQWDIYIDKCWFIDDGNFNKFQTVTWNHGVWFTNTLNTLKFIQGNTVQNVYQSCTDGVPSGVYLVEFYEHLLIGCPTYQGNYHKDWLMGCHLHDPSQWTPAKINEASYYEFNIDVVTGEEPVGLTGMAKLRDWVIVYTPSMIWYLEYVGLEAKGLVYQRKPLISGIGSAFKYGVIGNDLYHFFWSDENCYMIDGTHQRTMLAMPQAIGDDIKEFFFQDLNPDSVKRNMTWAYIDRFFNEVHWVYVSTTSDVPNKELVYNFKEKTWSVKTSDVAIYANTEVCLPQNFGSLGTITQELQDITLTLAQLNQPSAYVKRVLYGGSDYKVFRDEVPADVPASLLPIQNNPYLESQDEIYNSLNEVKHVDGLIIHGTYDPQTCEGIMVYVAARFSVADPINWQRVAIWQDRTEYGLFSFPRISGRVFRYKFEAIPRTGQPSVRSVVINAWAEYVFGIKKEVEK